MRNTHPISVTLPHDMAAMVKAKVASGEYATESEIIRDGRLARSVNPPANLALELGDPPLRLRKLIGRCGNRGLNPVRRHRPAAVPVVPLIVVKVVSPSIDEPSVNVWVT
jgi:hypothetical protein